MKANEEFLPKRQDKHRIEFPKMMNDISKRELRMMINSALSSMIANPKISGVDLRQYGVAGNHNALTFEPQDISVEPVPSHINEGMTM